MDLATLVGLLGAFSVVIGSMLLGGSVEMFFNVPSLLIVFVGSLFVVLMKFSVAQFFGAVKPIAVDHAVLERSSRVLVVPGDFGWDDVGTWGALRRVRALPGVIAASQVIALPLDGQVFNGRYGPPEAITDPAATHTYGRRYVFAGIEQTTLAVDTRINVTFTPRLSFQMYAQPFFSTGDYGAMKELRAPGEFAWI